MGTVASLQAPPPGTILQVKVDGRGHHKASPQPVRDRPQRELSLLPGCPAAKSYLTASHSQGPCCLPVPSSGGRAAHGGNWDREELSVAHLQMINLSYVADKGELSGSRLHCLLLET